MGSYTFDEGHSGPPSLSILVNRLNELRDETQFDPANNRVDQTLSDVFSLLSLFFLTVGKGKEAPATYCQLQSMTVSEICLGFPSIIPMPLLKLIVCPLILQSNCSCI